jgi:uncharacterized protein (DUF305 family)
MRIRQLIFASSLILLPGASAFAQEATPLPVACSAPQSMAMDSMKMDSMVGDMDEVHKAYMDAMMKMHPAMMQGISAKDPDVAFACGMIAHHQGAIDMSKVELKYGKDEDAKKKAQMIIDAQTKEIEEFTQWLSAHAK